MSTRSGMQNSLSRRWLFTLLLTTFALLVVFFQTNSRIANQPAEKVSQIAEKPTATEPAFPQSSLHSASTEIEDWSPVDPNPSLESYSDLSLHPSFSDFRNWLEEFNELNCSTMDTCEIHVLLFWFSGLSGQISAHMGAK